MQLDLNLLTALDALLEDGSVSGAAQRLHLSIPAMSRTLGRIRYVTKDHILVRTGRKMVPTPYSLSIRSEVHDLVQRAHAALMPTSPLDLATLSRTFTLQCHDSVTSAISPGLIVHLETLAPHVSLRILAESSVDTNELRHGNVDLEISSSQPAQPEIVSETIGHGQLVVAMRKDHPLTLRKLTIARYASARHITVSRRGRLSDPIDEVLATLGKQRRVVASAPTSSAALEIVAQSDLIACVVQGTCAPMICRLAIPTTPMPLKIAPVPMNMSWHRRYSTDIEHQWFREVVRRELAGVCDFPG